MKHLLSTLVLVLVAITVNAQNLYVAGAATQDLYYADIGAVVGEDSNVFLSFSFDSHTDNYGGFGYNYLPAVKGNFVSGFDAKALVFQGLKFGGAIQLKSGYRFFDTVNLTGGLEYLYHGNAVYHQQGIYPKLQVSMQL